MTIEQLKQQLDAANAQRIDATVAYDNAKKAYERALCDAAQGEFSARGITIGAKVFAKIRWPGYENLRTIFGIYMGHEVHNGSPRPAVFKIKKDGTAHPVVKVRAPYDAKWGAAE